MSNELVSLLDQGVEDRYFKALMSHPKLAKLTFGDLQPEHFSTSHKGKLFNALRWYWNRYDELPSSDILEITLEEMYDENSVLLIKTLLHKLNKIPVPEWKWILSKIDVFIKTIKLRKALFEASKLLDNDDFEGAEDKVIGVIRSVGLLDTGIPDDLDLTTTDILELAETEDLFIAPTRIYALDDVLHGFFRKEVFVLMAPLNVGKSWFMLNSAVSMLLSGKRVLYFTLEMARERVLERFLRMISGTVKPFSDHELKRVIKLWKDAREDEEKEEYEALSLLNTKKVFGHLQVLKKFGGIFVVKEYPSGEAKVSDIEKAINLFIATHEAPPDIIFVDGLMDMFHTVSSDENRQRVGMISTIRKLRKLAKEENCGVVISHQANRAGLKANIVGVEHTSEALGIMQVADTAVSLSQSKEENKEQKMKMFVMRSRNTAKWKAVRIYQNLDIGQFCLASHKINLEEEKRKGKK